MKYCAIASGSNGNSYYVADGEDAIMIDVGLNAKHIEIRMARLGLDPRQLKAIFITHEHTDHIRGLSVFCKRYSIPVYLTEGTYSGTKLRLPSELVHIIKPDGRVRIGSLKVLGIPKYHDAKEPCSFVVTNGKINVAILTDIGRPCANVQHVIQHSDVLLLESNYDETMLQQGRYSYFLKNRIRSGWGHISNTVACDLFVTHRTPRLKHLILGHLSGENNTVEIVLKTFKPHCDAITLSIASREVETPLFTFDELDNNTPNKLLFTECSTTITV